MTIHAPETALAEAEPASVDDATDQPVVEDLIEEVSIDGMCGVY